jgi:putative PIN family toxin of toxin-antitoxin system
VKVILDTNVFISGIFFSGPPYRILQAWRDGLIKLALTGKILEEYRRVAEQLHRQFPAINLQRIFELLIINAEIVPDQHLPVTICADPDDDKFIACALTARCKVIVSGDKHLLNIPTYRGIKVVTPRYFVETYLKRPHKN